MSNLVITSDENRIYIVFNDYTPQAGMPNGNWSKSNVSVSMNIGDVDVFFLVTSEQNFRLSYNGSIGSMQVAGGNVAYGSGVNGNATIDDFADMMTTLETKSDGISGLVWVCVTGTYGYKNFQTEAVNLAGNQNIQFMDNITQDGKPGGAAVSVGYNFTKVNMNGNTLIVVKHPMFDDNLAFTERNSNGELVLSNTYFLMNLGEGANKNLEILHKAANGVNRSMVQAKLNGMTGASETSITQEDAMTFAILKQDLLCVYNTQTCGIIYPS